MKFSKWLALIVASLALLGCGGKMAANQAAMNAVNQGHIDKSSDRPSCEIQPAEYALDTTMVAFELNNQAGAHVGFDIGGIIQLITVDFKANSGRMSMSMSLFNPLDTQTELLSALGKGTFYDFGAVLDVGFQNIGASLNAAHTTPLTVLTQNSLSDTLNALTTRMSSIQSAWSSEVMAVPSDDSVVVPVGSFAGLVKGDIFAIYNVEHQWSGEPCASTHLIAAKTTTQPVAYGMVSDIVDNAAVLTLQSTADLPRMQGVKILQGAKVEAYSLPGKNRFLSRLLEIRNVTGGTMSYANSQSVDITPYIKNQIHAIASNFGFMIYTP